MLNNTGLWSVIKLAKGVLGSLLWFILGIGLIWSTIEKGNKWGKQAWLIKIAGVLCVILGFLRLIVIFKFRL